MTLTLGTAWFFIKFSSGAVFVFVCLFVCVCVCVCVQHEAHIVIQYTIQVPSDVARSFYTKE